MSFNKMAQSKASIIAAHILLWDSTEGFFQSEDGIECPSIEGKLLVPYTEEGRKLVKGNKGRYVFFVPMEKHEHLQYLIDFTYKHDQYKQLENIISVKCLGRYHAKMIHKTGEIMLETSDSYPTECEAIFRLLMIYYGFDLEEGEVSNGNDKQQVHHDNTASCELYKEFNPSYIHN